MLTTHFILAILFILHEVNVLNGLYYCNGQLFAFPHPSCAYTSSADSASLSSRQSVVGAPSVYFCQGMTFTFPHPACQYSPKSDSLISRQVIVQGTPYLTSGSGYFSSASGSPIIIQGTPVATTLAPVNPVAAAIARCIAQGNVAEAGCTFTTGQIQADGTATCGQTCDPGPF